MKINKNKKNDVATPKETESSSEFVLEKKNYILLAAGFLVIVIGFFLMAGGKSNDPNVFNPEIFSFRRITLAPIILLVGFVIEIVAIMWRPKNKENTVE